MSLKRVLIKDPYGKSVKSGNLFCYYCHKEEIVDDKSPDGYIAAKDIFEHGENCLWEMARDLLEFFLDTCDVMIDGYELDGADWQDLAEQHGLIRLEEFDEEKHRGYFDADPGDILWLRDIGYMEGLDGDN